jgi:CheY-like chemotaxis protein/anti-sigma regulatory factor (Ser/Thr protein kinase)
VGRFIEHLQAAIEFRESFLANMSHELRTPLNAILGVTEVLQEGVYGTLTEKQLEVIQTVQDSGDHLLSLINDVLDLSKIESGETTLRVGECKLESLCNSTLRLLRQQIEGKGLELRFENLSKRKSIQAEGRRIRQVLLNLLSNAAKFTNQGHVSLRIDDLSGEDFLRIRVEDTGIGVSTEDQKKLFQPFFQVDHGPSRRYQGTGLGLAISLRTVELHGGRIELESTPGKGSCFTVLLPFEAKTSGLPADGTRKTGRRPDTLMRKTKPDPDPDPAASGPPPRKTSVRVLLVDDVEDNRTYLVDFLRDRGFQVEVADNGISALQQVSEQIPDIILLDIHMPVMNGVNVLRCLRAMPETRELPVIATSASVMGQDRDLCREIGASAFLPKPYKTKELMEEFGRLLDPDYIAQGGEGE